jgi:uridylate kinase
MKEKANSRKTWTISYEEPLTELMAYHNKDEHMRVVLRIGGSVVASPVDPQLISRYAQLLTDLKKHNSLVVVVGGGKMARELISVAKDIGLSEPAQDEIAISVSRIFAQFFLKKLGRIACRTVPDTLQRVAECLAKRKIVVMGGLKPGMTTDAVAALVARKVKADLLVKATNQDGVYDKDPENHGDATKIDHLKFDDLTRVLSEDKHRAGIHQIIDAEAVKILRRLHTKMVVVNGFNPENVLAAVKGHPVGTLIE